MKMWHFMIMLCLNSAVGMKAHSAHSLKMLESNGSNVSFLGQANQEAQVSKSDASVETNVSQLSQTNPKVSNFVGCPSEFPTLVAGLGYQGDKCDGSSTKKMCPRGCYRRSSKCLKAGTRSLCDVQDPTMCIAPYVIFTKPGPDRASECALSSYYHSSTSNTVAPEGCLKMLDYTHNSFAVQSNQFASPFMLVQLTSQKCLRASQTTSYIVWDDCTEDSNVLWATVPSAAIPSFIIKSQKTKKCIKPKYHSSGSVLYASANCDANDESLWFSKIEQEGTWQFVLQHVKSGFCIQTASGTPKITTCSPVAGTASDGPSEQFPVVKGKFLLYYPRTASAVGTYRSKTDRTAEKPYVFTILRYGYTNPLDEHVHFQTSGGWKAKFQIYNYHAPTRRRSMWYFESSLTSSRRRGLSQDIFTKDLTLDWHSGDSFRKIFAGGGGLFHLQHVKSGNCLSVNGDTKAKFKSDCKSEYETFRMLPANIPPCRVSNKDAPSVQAPFVGWKLVASSTHGLKTQIEVGMSSTDGSSVTKEEVQEFQNSMSVGATVGTEVEAGVFFAKAKVSAELRTDYTHTWTSSEANARSTESAETQEKVTSVGVSCPDPDPSMKMEYIYQWVGQNDKIVVKTEHFRCHQTDGPEYPPECPPQLCGDPKTNPYCAASPEGCTGSAGKSR